MNLKENHEEYIGGLRGGRTGELYYLLKILKMKLCYNFQRKAKNKKLIKLLCDTICQKLNCLT